MTLNAIYSIARAFTLAEIFSDSSRRSIYSINDFSIPAFKSFNIIDPVVDHFRDERNRIKEIHKGQDFLDLTLKKLTG
jgi:hypothetical protein